MLGNIYGPYCEIFYKLRKLVIGRIFYYVGLKYGLYFCSWEATQDPQGLKTCHEDPGIGKQ
jgi:hypothetical protein